MFDMSCLHYYTHLKSEGHIIDRRTFSNMPFFHVLCKAHFLFVVVYLTHYLWAMSRPKFLKHLHKEDPEDSSQMTKEAILLNFLVLSTSHRNFDFDVAALNNDKLKNSLFSSWKLVWKIKDTLCITSIHYVLK